MKDKIEAKDKCNCCMYSGLLNNPPPRVNVVFCPCICHTQPERNLEKEFDDFKYSQKEINKVDNETVRQAAELCASVMRTNNAISKEFNEFKNVVNKKLEENRNALICCSSDMDTRIENFKSEFSGWVDKIADDIKVNRDITLEINKFSKGLREWIKEIDCKVSEIYSPSFGASEKTEAEKDVELTPFQQIADVLKKTDTFWDMRELLKQYLNPTHFVTLGNPQWKFGENLLRELQK